MPTTPSFPRGPRHTFVLALAVAGGLLAAGEALAQNEVPGSRTGIFCRETYALCITAECKQVPVTDSAGGTTTIAACECDVIRDSRDAPAWSMGPSPCEARLPVEKDGKTYLVSAYSNRYNSKGRKVSVCDQPIEWAWCYGATCVVDPHDPTKAICNCPLMNSKANILGKCGGDLCTDGLWSASSPTDDCFANCRFYEQMTKNDRPVAPPATTCSNQPVCDCSKPRGERRSGG